MKKIQSKLIAFALELVLALSVVATASYAWLTMSSSPVVEGIQITIGGGNTILVAADLSRTVDGVTYHYPDTFGDTLSFGKHNGYEYLNDLAQLTPVSTADGLHWFLPTYYDLTDQEVQDGEIMAGTLKTVSDFVQDDTLQYANISATQSEEGGYIYLDFWVVSPGDNYTLRISTDTESAGSGSFAIALPDITEAENEYGYDLSINEEGAERSVRIGLLTDDQTITDNSMLYYQNSPGYSDLYRELRGLYSEPGEAVEANRQYRFTIYEPNGDAHAEDADGSYVVTTPIGLRDGAPALTDVRDILTVQKSSAWSQAQSGSGLQIQQIFQAALWELSIQNKLDELITPGNELLYQAFYQDYLGGQVNPYVTTGAFLRSTSNLYYAAVSGSADARYLTEEFTAGATEDVYIVELEKNVPQRIRMFVWLEGQDQDCIQSENASAFAIRLELAGGYDQNAEELETNIESNVEESYEAF